MDRKSLREFTHKAKQFLTLDNTDYKQWVFRYTFLELEKDLGLYGDITTNAIFEDNKRVEAKVVAKEDGVLAGLAEIKYFLEDSDASFKPRLSSDFALDVNFKDGDAVKSGDIVMTIGAGVKDLLAVERVVLNLLGRMSGVATFTDRLVRSVEGHDVLLSPTRKTLWGLLDKKAVALGGGGTHRLNLSDAILVKDTHLDHVGRDLEMVIEKIAEADSQARFVEIEVENMEEGLRACKKLSEVEAAAETVGVVLLDNMSPEDVRATIAGAKAGGCFESVLFEASGGINEGNVADYAATGVDIISMGCLTGGVKSLDLSMKV